MRKAPESGDMDRAVRTSLLQAVPILALHPFFRCCVLPLFRPVDGLLAGALADGAAGVGAMWPSACSGGPEMRVQARFLPLVLGCLSAVLLGLRVGAAAPAPIPVADLVEGFNSTFVYALSPDGRYVLRRDLRSSDLRMFPIAASGEAGEPVDLGRHRIRFTVWARDGSRLYGVRYRERTALVLVIDPARPKAKPREVPLPGVTGRVIGASLHPARDDRLVLRSFGREGEGIWHCGIDDPGCENVFSGGGGWRSVLDRDGRPAARHRFTGEAVEFQTRTAGAWERAGEMETDRHLAPVTPLDADGWGLALSNRTLDTSSLVRWNARTLEERAVFSTPEADLQQVLLSPAGEPLAAISFPGLPATTALHPAVERVLQLVRERHPVAALVNVTAADSALERFVAEVFDEVHARAAYVVDLARGAARELDRSPAGRFRRDFSATRPVLIPARDGLDLPGLLTVPRDPQGPAPPPLVLMVHGGPWLFYRWTFEPLTQLLASRGYAVLKVNYRGSAGYGNRFREAAIGELAGRVHDDVEDAVDWAVREGYGDRSRTAILGDSFGGFCVLTAMIRGHIPLQAGVVLNGVVDAEAMIDENTFSAHGQALWAKYLGTDDVDEMRRILREVSPVRRVDAIRAPLLLVTGNADRVVQSRHAARLAEEIRGRGRVVELLSFPEEGHMIARPKNVIETYRGILKFLGRHVN